MQNSIIAHSISITDFIEAPRWNASPQTLFLRKSEGCDRALDRHFRSIDKPDWSIFANHSSSLRVFSDRGKCVEVGRRRDSVGVGFTDKGEGTSRRCSPGNFGSRDRLSVCIYYFGAKFLPIPKRDCLLITIDFLYAYISHQRRRV